MSHRDGGLQGARTRRLIRDALIELVEERGFGDVTVGSVAKRALINRATFYRYYQDKYALVEEIFQEVISELPAELSPAGRISVQDRIVGWELLFDHVDRHHRLYAALLGRRGDPWFAARLRERCVDLARDRLRNVHGDIAPQAGGGMPAGELELVFAANLTLGAITWWLEHDRPLSARQMAEAVVRFATRGYFGALGLDVLPPGA
ncbi:TetR/AcrR family transcriptional regulator [Nonomuraea rhodomycinica]|uniref:TetR/AcrR family transcriptional regulator n=1 Tax=Nonomuraea rhodomycinica TaxID=1712872 RepID=A0A7Y6IVG8_9ACTN|nr:TetR/AcrR family transcriptional regulator [Nonomuraea rhodomycinica]NUW45147.1 TetR/AcrR family transcriptional regulator [Nonomuraea rhodomycinica]